MALYRKAADKFGEKLFKLPSCVMADEMNCTTGVFTDARRYWLAGKDNWNPTTRRAIDPDKCREAPKMPHYDYVRGNTNIKDRYKIIAEDPALFSSTYEELTKKHRCAINTILAARDYAKGVGKTLSERMRKWQRAEGIDEYVRQCRIRKLEAYRELV